MRETLRLSVLAIGRNEWKRSARLKAGGDVELDVDCEARDPSEECLGMSAKLLINIAIETPRRADMSRSLTYHFAHYLSCP